MGQSKRPSGAVVEAVIGCLRRKGVRPGETFRLDDLSDCRCEQGFLVSDDDARRCLHDLQRVYHAVTKLSTGLYRFEGSELWDDPDYHRGAHERKRAAQQASDRRKAAKEREPQRCRECRIALPVVVPERCEECGALLPTAELVALQESTRATLVDSAGKAIVRG
jgi:hypothetical protein